MNKFELNIRNSANNGWINLMDSSVVKVSSNHTETTLVEASDKMRSYINYLTTNKPKNVYLVSIKASTDLNAFTPVRIITTAENENLVEISTNGKFDGIVLSNTLTDGMANVLLRGGSILQSNEFLHGKTYFMNDLGNIDENGTTKIFKSFQNNLIVVL